MGIVNEIFLDTLSLLKNIELPVSLHSLVSLTSVKELGIFWLSIQANSVEENTVLTLSYENNQANFIFSGYLLKETVLLCGKSELTSAEIALKEIMQINNEQANRIRLTLKKALNILKDVERRETNESILNDFSAINNELMNSKRELTVKNQKIELLNQQLNAINENMKTFTYSVSHDLREPVRMVKSFLTLLHKKYGESFDEKGRMYIDIALDGANRLSKMLADLLEYHQSSDFSITETVDLNDVFLEVTQILQKAIEVKSAQVSSETLPIIKASFTGCRQVFQNLLSNALKFVPEGTTPIVSIRVQAKDDVYIISVKDNGIGIAENQQQEAFNLFRRLNAPQQYEGTGMGLAMVKKSLQRMGGEIWLESEIGKGCTVYFTVKKSVETLHVSSNR